MIGHEIDAAAFAKMVDVAARNLNKHVDMVNDLNVFPIPDGDTGDNMMMTLQGGVGVDIKENDSLSTVAEKVARGMLLSARGNSGVILSQFFAGIADGFKGLDAADARALEEAFKQGVKRAYDSVMTPTEGTILTVAKEATIAACNASCEDPEGFMGCFVSGAKESLKRTPDLLHVLKEAGVVDSGGAGLVYIAEGMKSYLTGDYEDIETLSESEKNTKVSADMDLFGPDSVLEFGYCTETLLRLQNSKCDVENFDVDIIKNYLNTIGNSIVCIKTDSIVKMHVHTMTPYKVLEFCQQYGEFLTIKIENMMLQHEGIVNAKEKVAPKPHVKNAVVAVANGEGVKADFMNFGCEAVIYGGQTMNPSSQDFIDTFDTINAENIYVLPNNGNIIMAANQAAGIYDKAHVYVVPTHSIGDGYAILSLLDLSGEPEDIIASMNESMEGVITAEISTSIRDAHLNGVEIKKDDYIGIFGKEVKASTNDIFKTAKETLDKMELQDKSLLLVVRGKDGTKEISSKIVEYAKTVNKYMEISETDGMQEVYPFLMIVE